MSTVNYHRIVKVDKENKFISRFNGNTGFYSRSGIITDMENFTGDTGVDPFKSCFPELIDIGIMGTCVCQFRCTVDCYQKSVKPDVNKGFTGKPDMTLDNFKWILDQCRGKVFQVALGGAGDPDTHENFEEILEYCYSKNVVPNFTTSGISMTDYKVQLCKKYCGAVAVSDHGNEYTRSTVYMLINNGVKTNIHYVLSNKTIDKAIRILNGEEQYYNGINAIVFLLYKPIGLGTEENILRTDDNRVKEFFNALDNRKCNFKVGFDSCSCSGLINYSYNYNRDSIDYCEGARFSMYISPDMYAMPCSFANQDKSWHIKLDDTCNIKDAWNSEIFEKFRNKLSTRCTSCKDRVYCGGGCPIIDSICLCNREERTNTEIHLSNTEKL